MGLMKSAQCWRLAILLLGGLPGFAPPRSGAEEDPPRVIVLEERVIEFPVSRDDVTTGIAVFNILTPEKNWSIAISPEGTGSLRTRGDWNSVELTPVGRNKLKLPKITITAKGEKAGPLCLGLKVWFNEITNVHDSPFYAKVPDRYSLVSWCSSRELHNHSRFRQNRVETLTEFKARLAKSFPLTLKENRVPWRPTIIADSKGNLFFNTLLVGRVGEGQSAHLVDSWTLDAAHKLSLLPELDRRIFFPPPEKIRELAEDPTVALLRYLSRQHAGASDGAGGFYATNSGRGNQGGFVHEVVHLDAENKRRSVAGSTVGFKDGAGAEAKFSNITALAVGPDGSIFAADGTPAAGSRIRRIASDGRVSTLAGGANVGFADGVGEAAKFHCVSDLAVSRDGNVFVADPANARVRKITPDGKVTTVWLGEKIENENRSRQPTGIALGPNGNLHILEGTPSAVWVRKINGSGETETLLQLDAMAISSFRGKK